MLNVNRLRMRAEQVRYSARLEGDYHLKRQLLQFASEYDLTADLIEKKQSTTDQPYPAVKEAATDQ